MPLPELLQARRTCLLVIDPQERLMPAIEKADRVVRNIRLMIECANVMGLPVIATTQYAKGLGPLVPEIAGVLSGASAIDKTAFNAFADPTVRYRIAEALSPAIDTIIVTGVEAHICVHQTVAGALSFGFHPWVVTDAIGSRNEKHAKAAVFRFHALGIPAGPAEMAVYELLGRAGTPEFKAMLPHLR